MSCLPPLGGAGKQLRGTSHVPRGCRANAALQSLRDELEDDDAVAGFVATYLSLLGPRIREIGRSIEEGRREECITRLLTLETSSDMVGASELSFRASALRLALGHHHTDTAPLYRDVMRAESTARELLAPPD